MDRCINGSAGTGTVCWFFAADRPEQIKKEDNLK